MISSCYEHEENVLRDRVSQFVLDLDSTTVQLISVVLRLLHTAIVRLAG